MDMKKYSLNQKIHTNFDHNTKTYNKNKILEFQKKEVTNINE